MSKNGYQHHRHPIKIQDRAFGDRWLLTVLVFFIFKHFRVHVGPSQYQSVLHFGSWCGLVLVFSKIVRPWSGTVRFLEE